MMGEFVVLGWLTLLLTDSPFLVGFTMGARLLPFFFVGVPAGILAARFPRHRLLVATAVGQAVTAAGIGALTLSDRVTLAHVLLLTFAGGALRAVEQAARQSYTHDVVGASSLMNAFAISGIAARVGWLLGSLGTGALIAHLGSGAAYLAVAVSYLAGAALLLPASAPPSPAPRERIALWPTIVGFVTAIRQDRILPPLMILTAGAEVLGFSHGALLPSLARDVLRVGPEGLGVMGAARSFGGILGLLLVTVRPLERGGGVLLITVLVAFGAGLVALGLSPHLVGFAGVVVVLVVINAAGGLSDLLSQSLMQLNVPGHLRGHAGGAWVVAVGLAPIGQIQIGALASLVGVSIALGASGVALVALTGAAVLLFPHVRRL